MVCYRDSFTPPFLLLPHSMLEEAQQSWNRDLFVIQKHDGFYLLVYNADVLEVQVACIFSVED
jgi:hypothetical protein